MIEAARITRLAFIYAKHTSSAFSLAKELVALSLRLKLAMTHLFHGRSLHSIGGDFDLARPGREALHFGPHGIPDAKSVLGF